MRGACPRAALAVGPDPDEDVSRVLRSVFQSPGWDLVYVSTNLEALAAVDAARVPAGKVYTAADIHDDPHYRARDMILQQATRDGHTVAVPGIVPKLSATPGTVRSSAPRLGDDTDAVLAGMGLTAAQIAELRARGVVA